jgi:hypothetical protein
MAIVVGAIGFIGFSQSIWFLGGSCVRIGGVTTSFLALFHLQNLPIASVITPVWIAIRSLEKSTQTWWLCKKHNKLPNV